MNVTKPNQTKYWNTLDGIIYAHNMLGKLFYEDNPNFNPEKWNIKGVFKTIRGE